MTKYLRQLINVRSIESCIGKICEARGYLSLAERLVDERVQIEGVRRRLASQN